MKELMEHNVMDRGTVFDKGYLFIYLFMFSVNAEIFVFISVFAFYYTSKRTTMIIRFNITNRQNATFNLQTDAD